MVKAPAHTKRVPSPKVLLEEGRIFLRKEFEHGSHLTLYHNGYVWFSAGKRNTVFHIHDCRGDYQTYIAICPEHCAHSQNCSATSQAYLRLYPSL